MPKHTNCYTINQLNKLETPPPNIAIKASLLTPHELQELIEFLTQYPTNVIAIDFSKNIYEFDKALLTPLMDALKECVNIVELNFDDSNIHPISEDLPKVLTALLRLQTLSFNNTKLPVAFVTALKSCPALTHLNLDNALNQNLDNAPQQNLDILNALADFPPLTSLSLACNDLGSGVLPSSSQFPVQQKHWHGENHIKILQALTKILQLPNLRALNLSANYLTDVDFACIFGNAPIGLQLRELNLENNDLSFKFLALFILNVWNKAKFIHTLNIQNSTALVTPTINQMNLLRYLIKVLAQYTQVLHLTLPCACAISNPSILASKFLDLKQDRQRMRNGIMCANRANIPLPPEMWQKIAGFINAKMPHIQSIPHSILRNIKCNYLEDSVQDDQNDYFEDSDQEEGDEGYAEPPRHRGRERQGHF